MNESDYLREQLTTERAHLQQILTALRGGNAAISHARPIALYVEWARQRLIAQLHAQQTALLAAPALDAPTRAQLSVVASASARAGTAAGGQTLGEQTEPLLALLDAWNTGLDEQAGKLLRVAHWRQAAHLSADTILEERQLYAAARGALGLA